MAINLSQALSLIREVSDICKVFGIDGKSDIETILANLELLDPVAKEKRWNALQGWLQKNPSRKKMIERNLTRKPSQVFDALLDEIDLDPNLDYLVNPLRPKVEQMIAVTQTLYKERKKQDA